MQYIQKAQSLEADILSGGVSWFDIAVQVDENLFWVKTFNGLQFTIIFQKFFNKILETDFDLKDASDFKISSLTENIFVIVPFISKQKEFGYYDITKNNNIKGNITTYFEKSSKILNIYASVFERFNNSK